MSLNYEIAAIIIVLVLLLIIYLIYKNRKDRKKYEQEKIQSEIKPEKHDSPKA